MSANAAIAGCPQVGVLDDRLVTLGGGATLGGIIPGAVTVFIIDGRSRRQRRSR